MENSNNGASRFTLLIFSFWLLAFSFQPSANAQKASDTLAVLKRFGEVMAFSAKPFVYYKTAGTISTQPILHQAVDSMGTINSELYKVGNDLYFGNEREEVFIQDSLYITVSHYKKTIRVRTVDMATKKRLSVVALERTDIQKYMGRQYTVSQKSVGGGTGQFSFASKASGAYKSLVTVRYKEESRLPVSIDVELDVEKPIPETSLDRLKKQPNYSPDLLKQIDGKTFLVMQQISHTDYITIDGSERKARGMPLWASEVWYDMGQKAFVGKGRCSGYEVQQ